jgi:4a-hydroxytetrahydrobiopterin dehydratase
MRVLQADEIQRELSKLQKGWSGDEAGLYRRLEFEDFSGAMQFMQACVDGIERLNHHPVWSNKFNIVEIRSVTLDVGNKVTQLDFELAHHFDEILTAQGEQLGLIDA